MVSQERCHLHHRVDEVFALRQMCEKYPANAKDVFWSFMGLEQVYDTTDRHGMWQMSRVYVVEGKLLKAVQNYYVDSRVWVRVGMYVSE